MKADYMRFIYECLSGDNGLLADATYEQSHLDFSHFIKKKEDADAVDTSKIDKVECEIYYIIHSNNSDKNKQMKMDDFYKQKRNLIDFLEHEIAFEYEKAKQQFFNSSHARKRHEDGDAKFHPVFLSSLLNQTVFLGDVLNYKCNNYIKVY